MLKRRPDLYAQYKGGLDGGDPHNPMGAAALYKAVNGRPTYYRIHDTNISRSIGLAYETGCIKLRNDHMQMLYPHVKVGTRMLVTQLRLERTRLLVTVCTKFRPSGSTK